MIKFGVFSDLHYDHIHDGDRRLDDFISNVKSEKVDFIVSLGDLCSPITKNKKIIDKLNSLNIPVYYTIGNHDSDYFNYDDVINFFGIEKGYYSFVVEQVKFIVLNSCYIKTKDSVLHYYKRNYNKAEDIYPYIPEIEQKWLIEEMKDDSLKYVIFSHHSLANDFIRRGIANRDEIRKKIENKNVLICINGHDHGDDCKIINGIPYYTLNSMSYIWHGTKEIFSYSDEIHEKYPYLKDMILYEDAFHAIVEINNNQIKVNGMQGNYQTITPNEVGLSNTWNGVSIIPRVSDFIK